MSEYQQYEFLTSDRPLSREQLDEVSRLSSHIEASSTHALIEYSWGDFKHDPIDVLYRYFDGFLYWANWGAPQLALRFPHGAAPANLLDGYDLDEFVTFTQHPDYDILDLHFGEMEGDLRSIYCQRRDAREAACHAISRHRDCSAPRNNVKRATHPWLQLKLSPRVCHTACRIASRRVG